MSSELARLVAPSGAAYSAPFRCLTPQSVFVEGRVPIGFGEGVRAVLRGRTLDARVAFVPTEPAGLVLVFDLEKDFEADARPTEVCGPSPWSDEDVTGTHDPSEVARYAAQAADRVEAENVVESVDLDSEDPTNPGTRGVLGDEFEITPSSVPTVTESAESGGLLQPVASQDLSPARGTRLRATTQVNRPALGTPQETEPD